MTARTEEQWEAVLFPEISELFPELYRDAVRTLSELGYRSSREARSHGFVMIRPARRQSPALWVHQERLPEINATAEVIAAHRSEEAARLEELRITKTRRAEELLAAYRWLEPAERDALR